MEISIGIILPRYFQDTYFNWHADYYLPLDIEYLRTKDSAPIIKLIAIPIIIMFNDNFDASKVLKTLVSDKELKTKFRNENDRVKIIMFIIKLSIKSILSQSFF